MQIGFDIGGTKTELCVIRDSQIIFRERMLNKDTIDGNLENIYSLMNKANIKKIKKIGFSLKGIINAEKNKIEKSSLDWLNNDFINKIQNRYLCDIKLQNDAKCFALAESKIGAGKGFNTGFYLILGTGVGGATIFNGNILSGYNNAAGEVGQMIYKGENKYEEFLSGVGFSKYFHNLKPQEIMDKYKNKDKEVAEYFNNFLDLLAYFLHLIIGVTAPEIIVVGGGLSNIQEIYKELPKYLKKYVYGFIPKITQNLLGDSSGVIGACFL